MCRSSPFRSTLNTGYITALDKCKVWTPFRHICPYFHNLYTLLCLKDDFTFTFPRGLIWKFDNPSTTLSVAPAKFDNPYKGAESAGCLKQPQLPIYYQPFLGFITIGTPFIMMASRAHLVGSHSSRASEFRTRSLLRGWRMISDGRHPRKQWHYYSHSLKLWNRIWMMFVFHLLHPFPNLRLCSL